MLRPLADQSGDWLQPAAHGTSARILVVEDETAIRELIADFLELEGYQVEQAAHGGQALAIVERVRPDLVVLDLMMPVMDGWTFARECYALSPANVIPMLVMSASHDLARSAEQLRPYGVRAVMPKPFDLDVLLAAVNRLAHRPAAVDWPG
jgi:two-component system, OmpR family, response regulator MprA